MSDDFTGNCLVIQTGTPNATSNASVSGIVSEALNHEEIEEIYGALNGLHGVLTEELIDLAEESQQTIRALRYTPGAALGSGRTGLKRPGEYERLFRVFEAHNIRFLYLVGGTEVTESAAKIEEMAKERGYALRTLLVPSAAENDITVTDHCPGFGSAELVYHPYPGPLVQRHTTLRFLYRTLHETRELPWAEVRPHP